MKIQKINIPIYNCTLIMIFDKDLSYVQKKYKTENLLVYDAVTIKINDCKYLIAMKSHCLSNVAHEIIHIINYIYEDCSIQLDRYNDEPQAYLAGWLFSKIEKFLTNK